MVFHRAKPANCVEDGWDYHMICEEKTIDGTDKKGYGCGTHEPNPMITYPAD